MSLIPTRNFLKYANSCQGLCNTNVSRHLFGFPSLSPPNSGTSAKRKKYSERRILGWSQEQLYDIVANVDDYNKFLPACNKSLVTERAKTFIKADLEIGLPPLIVEKYSSHVTLDHPHLVKAVCFEGRLFKHLETEWQFSEGIENNPNTVHLTLDLISNSGQPCIRS
ncbi:Coenzyme Q-binding protein COQ10 -like protein A, mitochondrial [Halotydeus destructor]|nr:Coenzyme Q-binding protein COQ10 -like protein A, mitochondrial [Halotydeus destructor]